MNEMTCPAGAGTLQAYIDSELAERDVRRVERHLSACDTCGDDLAELRGAGDAVAAALQLLDPPAGAVPPRLTVAAGKRRRAGSWAALPRAAVLVLGLAAAAAAAVPGSPIRGWLESMVANEGTVRGRDAAERAGGVVPAASPESGVSVEPESDAVHVVIDPAEHGLVVVAVLSDGRRAGVYASGAASSAKFRTAPGRIEVAGAATGVLLVEIPRGVGVATVEVAGARRIEKDGDVLRLAAGGTGSSGERVTYTVR